MRNGGLSGPVNETGRDRGGTPVPSPLAGPKRGGSIQGGTARCRRAVPEVASRKAG